MVTQTTIDERLRAVLADILGLSPERAAAITPDTQLFGAMPELDSMAVAGLLTEIEDQFHIVVEDEDVNGDMLETMSSLSQYVAAKLAA